VYAIFFAEQADAQDSFYERDLRKECMDLIKVNINEKDYVVQEEHEKLTLLTYLRNVLDLTGAKCGCAAGDCGACKVLINGEAKNSCLFKMNKLEGARIVTIEGIGTIDHLHPIQAAFIKAGAVQCGYCTPGMVITTKALLDKNPDPTHEEICAALDQNLCRCTGYYKIIDAVKLAASMLREEAGR